MFSATTTQKRNKKFFNQFLSPLLNLPISQFLYPFYNCQSTVYLLISPYTKKYYIGETKQSLYDRWKQHCYTTNNFENNSANYASNSNYLYRFLYNFNILKFMIIPIHSSSQKILTDSVRKNMESNLIKRFSPALNTMHNNYSKKIYYNSNLDSNSRYRTRPPKWIREKFKQQNNIPNLTTDASLSVYNKPLFTIYYCKNIQSVSLYNLLQTIQKHPSYSNKLMLNITVCNGIYNLSDLHQIRSIRDDFQVLFTHSYSIPKDKAICTLDWIRKFTNLSSIYSFSLLKQLSLNNTNSIKDFLGYLIHHPYANNKQLRAMNFSQLQTLYYFNQCFWKHENIRYFEIINTHIQSILRKYFNISYMQNLSFSIPYSNSVQLFKLRKYIYSLINQLNIPPILKAFIIHNCRIVYSNHTNIKQLLTNHIKTAKEFTKEDAVQIRNNNYSCNCKGHPKIYDYNNCDALEYSNPELLKFILSINSTNIVRPSTSLQLQYAIRAFNKFRSKLISCYNNESKAFTILHNEILTELRNIFKHSTEHSVLNTKYKPILNNMQASTLNLQSINCDDLLHIRSWLKQKDLVCMTIDKNANKLAITCKCHYYSMLSKLYLNDTVHYEAIQLTSNDIKKQYLQMYNKKGWAKHAKFNSNAGSLPYAYAIVKQKDYNKLRPIVSYFNHYCKRMFKLVGNILTFMWTNLDEVVNCNNSNNSPSPAAAAYPHFGLHNISKMKSIFLEKLDSLKKVYAENTRLHILSADIANMYTSLPHEVIREAVLWLLNIYSQNISQKIRLSRNKPIMVYAHRFDKKGIYFNTNYEVAAYKKFTLEEIYEVIEFDLNNVYFTVGSDIILKQKQGLPMGGLLSAALANITCMYREYYYINSSLKIYRSLPFTSIRYMDDKLTIIAANNTHTLQQQRFHVQNLKNHLNKYLYPKQLKLEWQEADLNNRFTYLESLVYVNKQENNIIIRPYRKNFETISQLGFQKYLILQDFYSFTSFKSKLGVIISLLLRLERNSTDFNILSDCILTELIPELLLLHYPINVLCDAINSIIHKIARRNNHSDNMKLLQWKIVHFKVVKWLNNARS